MLHYYLEKDCPPTTKYRYMLDLVCLMLRSRTLVNQTAGIFAQMARHVFHIFAQISVTFPRMEDTFRKDGGHFLLIQIAGTCYPDNGDLLPR
jgi:hypothetical protein